MDRPTTILWLRRDLRLHDHPALVAAVDAARTGGGALLPIFIWEPGLYSGARSSGNRTWFVRESLAELRSELQSRGSTLLELRGPALVALPRLVEELRAGGNRAVDIFATRDHTPYARGRDQSVAEAIAALGGTLHLKRGLLVVEPDELFTGGGTPYGVYTPYFRRWLERVSEAIGADRKSTRLNSSH